MPPDPLDLAHAYIIVASVVKPGGVSIRLPGHVSLHFDRIGTIADHMVSVCAVTVNPRRIIANAIALNAPASPRRGRGRAPRRSSASVAVPAIPVALLLHPLHNLIDPALALVLGVLARGRLLRLLSEFLLRLGALVNTGFLTMELVMFLFAIALSGVGILRLRPQLSR